MGFFATKALPEFIEVDLGHRQQRIRLKRNLRAKRYILRMPPGDPTPIITVPARGTLKTALDFASRHAGWLTEKLNSRPASIKFEENARIPVRGVLHTLRASGKLRGLAQVDREEEAGELLLMLPGETQSFHRKTKDFLRKIAKQDIEGHVERLTKELGRGYHSITLRDTKSRWGSCSVDGKLSFSWRLVMAPPDILEYVAAHEVAHLAKLDHSPEFWQICERLAPHTKQAQRWLKEHGSQLHLYGQD
ncbi:hypothetical protein PsAD2_01763 [Pseudovibrio axinellae]|uniref:YgjP-like metallopeptidase domain-containing protein n=1 Tax=Pseudovibrio axinellae TaxID=989403 RepID=A0A165Z3T5_9HYPH|nr:SprT family zinc-dependent metalloprotease [Pseudovibrio axinellae]KZL19485.1 hypothetical protein PsAD2_01763 [Pseudovibrio axinellae]SEQ28766.1 hypothetical protein SAMN05421798_102324 [Pseudovibrio axinellae]